MDFSQEKLAAVSGVSFGSVKAYEAGRRHATRPMLAKLLDAMKISRAIRNEVLTAAGFAPDDDPLVDPKARRIKREEALDEIARYRWPSMLISENAEILGANVAARKLWQIEPFGSLFKLGDPAITVATHPEIVKRIVNWEEAVGQQIAGWKSQMQGEESLDEPSPYFARVVEQLTRGEPEYVQRFVELWEHTQPGFNVQHRWPYKILWLEPGFGDDAVPVLRVGGERSGRTGHRRLDPLGRGQLVCAGPFPGLRAGLTHGLSQPVTLAKWTTGTSPRTSRPFGDGSLLHARERGGILGEVTLVAVTKTHPVEAIVRGV